MRRVAGCLVVLLATAAAWLGCRQGLGLDRQFAIGSGTDTIDAAIDVGGGPGSGSDAAIDAAIDAPIDGGSGSDAMVDASIDATTLDAAIDGPGDAVIDAPGDASIAPDGPGPSPSDDASSGDGHRGSNPGPLDQTSFYACAGGGCGSTAGAEVWLPIAIAVGFATRRRRGRRPAAG